MRLPALSLLTLCLTLATLLSVACSRSSLLDDGIGCFEGRIELTRANPTAIFLLDRSESMNTPMFGGDFAGTRWDALSSALATTLPNIDSSTQIGALLFPARPNSGNCSVSASLELTPGLGNVQSVIKLLRNNSPGGATPTDLAIKTAAAAILGTRTLSSARALVLATDGGPDCNMTLDTASCRCTSQFGSCVIASQCLDDKRTIEHIAEFRDQGLPTYVIGIQSSGDMYFSDVLDAMADAGGRPQIGAPQKYYAARSPSELNAALTAISEQVGACVFLANSVPDSGGTIVVALNGLDLTADQWSWHDRKNGELWLEASICAQVRAMANPVLTARVSCADG